MDELFAWHLAAYLFRHCALFVHPFRLKFDSTMRILWWYAHFICHLVFQSSITCKHLATSHLSRANFFSSRTNILLKLLIFFRWMSEQRRQSLCVIIFSSSPAQPTTSFHFFSSFILSSGAVLSDDFGVGYMWLNGAISSVSFFVSSSSSSSQQVDGRAIDTFDWVRMRVVAVYVDLYASGTCVCRPIDGQHVDNIYPK